MLYMLLMFFERRKGLFRKRLQFRVFDGLGGIREKSDGLIMSSFLLVDVH